MRPRQYVLFDPSDYVPLRGLDLAAEGNTPMPATAFADRTTACRWCGATLYFQQNDIFCCPLAVESPHCLWCGEDLPPGRRSFCRGICSTEFHADVAHELIHKLRVPRTDLRLVHSVEGR